MLQSESFQVPLMGMSRTAQAGFNKNDLSTFTIPLPPFAEQHRIVDCIESLFAKLDEGKQKAQDWKSEQRKPFQDVCEKIVYGKTPTGFISPTGKIPYLKVYNIVNNKIDFESTPQFIPKEIHEGKLKSSILKPHDVVINIVGPILRKLQLYSTIILNGIWTKQLFDLGHVAPLQHRFYFTP